MIFVSRWRNWRITASILFSCNTHASTLAADLLIKLPLCRFNQQSDRNAKKFCIYRACSRTVFSYNAHPVPREFYSLRRAGIAQLVEHDLAKVGVASSSLVSRSKVFCSDVASVYLSGNSSVGRARPCQGRGREFESRFPLQTI